MPNAIKLENRKPITFESALKKDASIISQAVYLEAATELYQSLWDQRQTIEALVRHHLRLTNRDICIINAKNEWIRGSFNVCMPVEYNRAAAIRSSSFVALCHTRLLNPSILASWMRI